VVVVVDGTDRWNVMNVVICR